MILKELIRLSSQHRTLYCYLILSVWIFLLIAGMYKYIGTTNSQLFFGTGSAKQYNNYFHKIDDDPIKVRKFQQDCNPIDFIVRKDEGGLLDGWNLQGVLLLTRHGDRGPMAHVRGINSVNCGHENNPLLNKYKTFLANATTSAPAGHATWTKTGPFHSFPLLPAFAKSCLLGQLTYKGIGQMLHIGDILRQVYGNSLGLLSKPVLIQKAITNSSQPTYIVDEIVIYSTRYRRTFQSAMALLFGFVPTDRWLSLTLRESHSLAFCFSDCACSQADYLKNELSKESTKLLEKNAAMLAIIQWIGSSLLQNPPAQLKPMEVRDAVLSILCHNGQLPCHKSGYNDFKSAGVVWPTSTVDPSEFINIDQDDGGNNQDNNRPVIESDRPTGVDEELEGCIDQSHVAALMSYTNWQGQQEAKHKFTRQQGILRAYGLIRNIVNFMLKMISGDKTKFVLYSGHDRTMQFLTAALGIQESQNYFIPYAARIAFEVYKSEQGADYYFRLVYNGHDVTRQIDFCEGGKSLRVNRDSRGSKADLCPIENIIRFIHDDYFSFLNASNFKDACALQKKSEF